MIYIAGATPPAMQLYVVQLQRGVDEVPGFPDPACPAGEASAQKRTNKTQGFVTNV
jgi:hypothetical protein